MRKAVIKAQPVTRYPPFALQGAGAEQWSMPFMTLPEAQSELYQRLSWVQMAVRICADIGATQKLNVLQMQGEGGKQVTNHPFEVLLGKPNPLMSRFALLAATFSYKRLTGNAYWWLNRPTPIAPPDEIWLIPSHQIKPIPDGKLYLKGYEYDTGGGNPLFLPVESVCHFKNFNPLSQFVGLSPIEALATVAIGDMAMQRWNTNYFDKNNAKLPGALTFAQMIPDGQWKQIQDEFKRQYGGTERNLLMLRGTGDNAVNWVQMAASQKDMEFLAGRQSSKEEIFQMLGVPPGMMDKNATEANAIASKSVFFELSLWPELVAMSETITNTILPAYGDGFVAQFEDPRKTDRALELQEQAEYARTHTIDEVRAKWYDDGKIGDERGNLLIAEISPGGMPGIDVPEKPAPVIMQPNQQPEEDKPDGEPADEEQPEVPPAEQGAPKALLDNLQFWRRKCKEKGRFVDYERRFIPPGIKALVAQRLTDDLDTAFAFLKSADMDAADAALQKRILKVLQAAEAQALEAIAAGQPFDYDALSAELRAAIQPQLVSVVTEQTLRNAIVLGIDFDIAAINDAALEWAQGYAYSIVEGITATTRKVISKAVAAFVQTPGMTQADLRSMLTQTFGPVRAQMIGTTEVTRAYSEATNVYQSLLAELGVDMVRVWSTSADDKVCSVCGPLNRKPEKVWAEMFPAGPPGHINCRCTTGLELAKGGAK